MSRHWGDPHTAAAVCVTGWLAAYSHLTGRKAGGKAGGKASGSTGGRDVLALKPSSFPVRGGMWVGKKQFDSLCVCVCEPRDVVLLDRLPSHAGFSSSACLLGLPPGCL